MEDQNDKTDLFWGFVGAYGTLVLSYSMALFFLPVVAFFSLPLPFSMIVGTVLGLFVFAGWYHMVGEDWNGYKLSADMVHSCKHNRSGKQSH